MGSFLSEFVNVCSTLPSINVKLLNALDDFNFISLWGDFWLPIDAYTEDNKYIVEVDVPPGVKKEDIKISYYKRTLKIEIKRERVKERKKANYVFKERNFGKLVRVVATPDIYEDEIKAEFENGVLKITAPLKIRKSKEKEIKIK